MCSWRLFSSKAQKTHGGGGPGFSCFADNSTILSDSQPALNRRFICCVFVMYDRVSYEWIIMVFTALTALTFSWQSGSLWVGIPLASRSNRRSFFFFFCGCCRGDKQQTQLSKLWCLIPTLWLKEFGEFPWCCQQPLSTAGSVWVLLRAEHVFFHLSCHSSILWG